jgi:hypothetical protein
MHLQTLGRTHLDTFFTAYAGIGDHSMDLLGCTNNCIGGTDFKTAGATGAGSFADSGNQ